jgi:hypothetical protein
MNTFFFKFGVFALSLLNEEAAEQLKSHFVHLLKLFSTILTDLNNLKSAFYVINSLKFIIPYTNEVELVSIFFNFKYKNL